MHASCGALDIAENDAPPSTDRYAPPPSVATRMPARAIVRSRIAPFAASTSRHVMPPSVERYSLSPAGGLAPSDDMNTTSGVAGSTASA